MILAYLLLGSRGNTRPPDYTDWTKSSGKAQGVTGLTPSQQSFLDELLEDISSAESPHAVIIGEAGSGKSTVVRALAEKLCNNDHRLALTGFKDAKVWAVDADALNSTPLVGALQAKFKAIWNAAAAHYKKTGQRVILFFDEFHRLMQLGVYWGNSTASLSETLKTLTGNEADYCGVHIIGATTDSEYQQYVQKTGSISAISRRFSSLELPPATVEDAHVLLERYALEKQHQMALYISDRDCAEIIELCIGAVVQERPIEQGINIDRLKKLFNRLMKDRKRQQVRLRSGVTEAYDKQIYKLQVKIDLLKYKRQEALKKQSVFGRLRSSSYLQAILQPTYEAVEERVGKETVAQFLLAADAQELQPEERRRLCLDNIDRIVGRKKGLTAAEEIVVYDHEIARLEQELAIVAEQRLKDRQKADCDGIDAYAKRYTAAQLELDTIASAERNRSTEYKPVIEDLLPTMESLPIREVRGRISQVKQEAGLLLKIHDMFGKARFTLRQARDFLSARARAVLQKQQSSPAVMPVIQRHEALQQLWAQAQVSIPNQSGQRQPRCVARAVGDRLNLNASSRLELEGISLA